MSAQFVFEAIGTHWQIDIFAEISLPEQAILLEKIKNRIEQFDKNYSRFRDDSLITKMANVAGTYELPADAAPLFLLYRELYTITGGAFTPLIGQVLVDAGYDADYSLLEKSVREPQSWEDVIELSRNKIIMKKPALLDFGAAGKGYLVDIVADLLRCNGFNYFCVDAGGDIFYQNNEPLRVGLENPNNLEQVIGVVTINNQSICGSAGNRRAWGNWHHIIDPRILTSPRDILATWVVADTALLADGLATALFFVNSNILQKKYSFEYAILNADLAIETSLQFPAEIFVQ